MVELKITDSKAVEVKLADNKIIQDITKPIDGSEYRVLRFDGVGYKGKNPAFTDVTDDVVKQVYANEGNLESLPTAAGKEGGEGEYNINNEDIDKANQFKNGKPASYRKTDYRKIFFKKYPKLKGKVVVHHSIPRYTLKYYPGLFSESKINTIEHLRGIPKEINSDIHLSEINTRWNDFYRDVEEGTIELTEENFLDMADEIDKLYGKYFNPPIN